MIRHRAIISILLTLASLTYLAYPGWLAYRFRNNNDYKHMYLGMQALYDGDSPYPARNLLAHARLQGFPEDTSLNPYVYLPFTGLVLGFMQPLRFPAASEVWFFANHLMMLGSIVMMARSSRFSRRTAMCIILALVATSHPFYRTLTAGQLNVVLLLCLVAAFELLRRGREFSCGTVLGFAAMFKLAPFLFVGYFVFTRRWRALLGFASATACFAMISIMAVGFKVHLDFLPMLRQMSYGKSTWHEYGAIFWKDPWNQGLNSFLTHVLVQENGVTQPWIQSTQFTANILTIIATSLLGIAWTLAGVLVWKRSRPPQFSTGEQGLFHATILLMLLIPSLMWDHYLVMLIPPLIWIMERAWCGRSIPLLIIAIVCSIMINIPWDPAAVIWRNGLGIIVMSNKLWYTLLVYCVCCHLSLRENSAAKMSN